MIEKHSGIEHLVDPYERIASLMVGGTLDGLSTYEGRWNHQATGLNLEISEGKIAIDASRGNPVSMQEVFRARVTKEGELIGRTYPHPAAEFAFSRALEKLESQAL